MFTLTVKNLSEWEKLATEAGLKPNQVLLKLNEIARVASELVLKGVQAEAPVKTGALRDSMRVVTQGMGASRFIQVLSDKDYAKFVEFGTKPHVIKAKNAKVLSFSVNGEQVFTKQVEHPGTKPNEFIQRGFDVSRPAIEAEIKRIVEQALKFSSF